MPDEHGHEGPDGRRRSTSDEAPSRLAELWSLLTLRAPASSTRTGERAAALLATSYFAFVLLVDIVETKLFWDRYKGTGDQRNVQVWLLIAWELAVVSAAIHAWVTFNTLAARRLAGAAYIVGFCCALLLLLVGAGALGLFLILSGRAQLDDDSVFVYLPIVFALLWVVYMFWRLDSET
jgi:hypothetical protein